MCFEGAGPTHSVIRKRLQDDVALRLAGSGSALGFILERRLSVPFLPLFPTSQSPVPSILRTAVPSAVVAKNAFPTAKASCGSWSGSMRPVSSSPRIRGARSRQPLASLNARLPSGFRTAGSRRKRFWPRSRPALPRERQRGWAGERGLHCQSRDWQRTRLRDIKRCGTPFSRLLSSGLSCMCQECEA